MPRLTAARMPRRAARRGFTLTELLMTIVILAIVGTALTRLLLKQQQYYKDATLTSRARRELRLGATVLPAELRSISTAGGDVLSMAENQVTMRAFIGTSMICARGTDWFITPPPNLAKHTLTSYVATPVVGDTAFVYDENILKGSEDDEWRKFRIVDVDGSVLCPGAPYMDPVLDAPAIKRRRIYRMHANLPDSVKVGAVVRFTRPVRYEIYTESSGNAYLGMSEYRNGAWQAVVPIAGPYRPFLSGDNQPSGLQFRYYDTLGVRITNYSQVTRVSRVDVFLRTNAGVASITERKGNLLQDSVVMRVAIRNYK